MSQHVRSYKTSILTLGGLILMLPACGSDEVTGSAEAVSKATQALTVGEIASVNGTYGVNCDERTGAWSLEVAPAATLDNPEVSVILNDADCVLTLTEVHTTAGIISAIPAIPLGTSYAVSSSAFGSVPVEFYANANLTPAGFGANFLITLPFSDDPALLSDSNTANYAVVVSSVTAESVPAPNYTIDVSGLAVLTDIDDVVQSVTGTADLTAGSVTGQTYVVVAASGLGTYDEIDTAYEAGTPAAMTLNIPAADFTLVGEDLTVPVVRTLIIANISEGVPSYEAFEITFNAPS
jgi:hypothetical protein